jgi:GT2 family glycosyltransferase
LSWPSVAVIVLNWNGKAYLSDCLTSLRQQTYPGPWQVVLVDNGSTDGSEALVRRDFPEVRVIRSPVNLGFAAGNNLAARQLDTDLVALLNNDTRADPNWLAELVAAVTSAPDVAAAGGKILSWDGRRSDFLGGGVTLTGFGVQLGFGEPATEGGAERDVLFACGGSMIVKRKPYLEVGGLDDDYFLYYEDVDLGWRLWIAGYRVRYAPRSVVFHRHGGSRSWNADQLAFLYERNALYTIYKNYDDGHLARVLPAALLLAAKRAALVTGVDRRRFVLSSTPESRPAVGDAAIRRNWSTLRDSLRRRGVPATADRIAARLRGRIGSRWRQMRVQLGQRVAGREESVMVPSSVISRLAALEVFGSDLPALQIKRLAIQGLRRRSDEEILPLFEVPFEPSFARTEYIEYHHRLLRALNLSSWVEVNPSR